MENKAVLNTNSMPYKGMILPFTIHEGEIAGAELKKQQLINSAVNEYVNIPAWPV